ncbi:type II toxin-antitoxin system VapB family antitoxin [Synechococcus sp. EJ6-Ellesmere]|uniref:type II toxin-antitoxin system VapB family antitoxin n=1 Tax=Synechococcus sp. EJ6-Ellesmere TaxID=2823734 RepID=UPI0020CE79A8|nr:type II toxin-antitoxin system VapB family antitoxin [Synechococcus sp. EJ6-Ellesmere]MCP9824143.1 type II toxin-antitoxin system VapB family antitoxin [Synechococcus sp. EJ6-Ellesmere]
MNIKDPKVHAMARQLAVRRGTTVTDAVRQALSAELERSGVVVDAKQQAKQDQLLSLLERFRQIPWPDRRSGQELQDELYDNDGLPI